MNLLYLELIQKVNYLDVYIFFSSLDLPPLFKQSRESKSFGEVHFSISKVANLSFVSENTKIKGIFSMKMSQKRDFF